MGVEVEVQRLRYRSKVVDTAGASILYDVDVGPSYDVEVGPSYFSVRDSGDMGVGDRMAPHELL